MNLFQFQLMSQGEQLSLLYREGIYVGKRKDDLTFLLYQVDTFYVEVAYHKYRCHIAGVRATMSTTILDPYLEQIDIAILAGIKP